ncbi:probable stress-associated endoplasmic reticulum protein [Ananas comosus]|uniref:Probable stress-associated endoplasmic reticulum protein n=1 Tax=Ananas comosus TaxID=4615 RepID=A0A6P5F9H5_ANACO|nr:probable stress-associated endoplasmic reticulum protein [Ananas comosus]
MPYYIQRYKRPTPALGAALWRPALLSRRFFFWWRRVLLRVPAKMTTSRRLADKKIAKFQKNIMKRGSVPETSVKKGYDYPVGPIVLGFFIFVVIGSSLFQIIRTATSGGVA